MTSSSSDSTTADLVEGTAAAAAGLGIITMMLFPLAIPVLALTAVALIPLLIPLLLIPLVGGLVAAPFLLLRRLVRQAAVAVARRNTVGDLAMDEEHCLA